ncbi:MAG: methyltransferase, TIGR04325 family [Stellaceae bacterium]|jgi:putative methyltransferase (TIGR04325 family)
MAAELQIYPNYQAAIAACGRGYDDPDIAKVIAFKTDYFAEKIQKSLWPEHAANTIFAVGIAAGDLSARPLRVLDFGGGCGFHYFAAKAAFKTSLRWAVAESPAMAEQARAAAKGRFEIYEDITAAAAALGRVDLVHASSVIQYVPDPLATLDALIALRAPYVMLARLPVWSKDSFVGVQQSSLKDNGIGPMPSEIADRPIRYPITIKNINDIMSRFERDYEMIVSLPSPSSEYKVTGNIIGGVTFIFRAK